MRAPLALRVLGTVDGRRDLVSYRKASALYAAADPSVRPAIPAFLSTFTYPPAMRQHVEATGSTKDYVGPVGVPALRWDIDRDGDPDAALCDTKRLAGHLAERYGNEGLSVFYSGHKGYHIEAETAGAIEPTTEAHTVARQVAETIACTIGVAIDAGVYDRVRLWRAPNSRHSRTAFFKIRIELDDLLHASTDWVCRRAVEPISYDPPMLAAPPLQLLDDWRQAEQAVRARVAQQSDRRQESGIKNPAHVNALTRLLITRPEEIEIGDRHRLLFSTAANLAKFGSIDDLILALLTEPGRDTGLPLREVERQIRCGIDHARRQSGEGGAS
jgi:hypothetical protein